MTMQSDFASEVPRDPTPAEDKQTTIPRGPPNPDPARRALVTKLTADVRKAKRHFERGFRRMREDQRFARGYQWPAQTSLDDDRYQANITQRHIAQRVSALYAKNPTVVARRRERLEGQFWDGTSETFMTAMQMAQMGHPQAALIVSDAMQVMQRKEVVDRIARTLELLYNYQIDEQAHPFIEMMKLMVRRAVTCGVGYVKIGYQRHMQRKPEIEARINDAQDQLARVERLAQDLADNEAQIDQSEAEQLKIMMNNLMAEPELVVREGLVFDFPPSQSIIPDVKCVNLSNFLGAEWVAQEYLLTPEQVQEIYQVDISSQFTAHRRVGDITDETLELFRHTWGDAHTHSWRDSMETGQTLALVWEMWNRQDGTVYTLVEGYPDFLTEPGPPDVWTERFWPWFPFIVNDLDDPSDIMPLSDVALMRHQQREINRSREGLREHRIANRPKTAVPSGMLSETDVDKLKVHPANAVIELQGLQPGQRIDDLLQAVRGPGIDPNLYEVNPQYQDILRSLGQSEAMFGGTGGDTATENQIAEGARLNTTSSVQHQLDILLSGLARAGGQILLGNMAVESVKQIVGPGAAWPELSRDEIAREIFLEVEAGSSGDPNQARDVRVMRELVPLLIQIPGINPVWLAREMIKRLGDRLDLAKAMMPGLPSIMMMNQMQAAQAQGQAPGANAQSGDARTDPAAQGPQGAANAPAPPQAGGQNVVPLMPGAAPSPGPF